MANEEKELYKFINDSKYRDKVIAKLHRNEDAAYDKRIKQIEYEKSLLNKKKTNEITRISKAGWEKIAGGKLMVNRTEGKIQINNTTALFSSIKGAELNMMVGCRVVTTENSKTKSKKHASLGGAVAGGVLFGPVGAVAGGVGLGKTTGKTTGTSVSKQIPTCTHLGVMVNIDGFISEVVLISDQVDQSSFTFSNAQNKAQNIIAQLRTLAKIPVPTQFLKPEEESTVKAIENQIENKQLEMQNAINNKPTYALPSIYRTVEQKEMSDEEYLEYLKNMDTQKMMEKAANDAVYRQVRAERKAANKEKKATKWAENQSQTEQDEESSISIVQVIGSTIYKVVFWILSAIMLVFASISFSLAGIASGTLFLVTAVMINPLAGDIIRDKLFAFPKWMVIIILIIGFFAGVLTFPTV